MSDKSKVLQNQLGTPLVWIKNANDEIVKDIEGQPLSVHIVEFKYTYDEENDDECEIKFNFTNKADIDNIIFIPSSVLKLQWGYITTSGELIKSPIRSVSLRDTETEYSETRISFEIKCTDLISYLKNIKTNSVRNNTDYFVDWLKEISTGKFKATITSNGYFTLIDKQGTVKNFEFDERENVVIQKAVDNARFETQRERISFRKIIKGKSLAINNAIDDLIKDLPDGPYIQDSTDDVLEIKKRNFKQKIFKSFTWTGTTGELLKFKSKTNTKMVKEDQKLSIKVNPKTKKIKEEKIDTADTTLSEYIRRANGRGNLSKKPSQQEIDEWLERVRGVYQYNIDNPTNQREVPDLSYKRTVVDVENYMGQTNASTKLYTFSMPAREVLNDPELLDELSKNRLTNRAIEKLQKKYSADCKIIGDPSMIKGKVYYFSNLSKNDIGRWYSTKVEHIIDDKGYYTEMDLVKVPNSILVNQSSIERDIQNSPNEVNIENSIDNSKEEFYSPNDRTQTKIFDEIDNDDVRIRRAEESQENFASKFIRDRVSILEKNNNFINEESSIDNGDVFDILKIDTPPILNQEVNPSFKKINTDEF